MPFPFADFSSMKLRPAVIISADPQGSELLIAFVTSVMTNRSPRGAEVELLPDDAEFAATGLKVSSLLRLDKVATVSRTVILRRLGALGRTTKATALGKLRLAFGL
ncbi:MAG: type II toxin-antitoxin system PemK/MazF family toxin [Phycisphaerales bacterium]|nr:type II toxin-antitoxin system PemK/MazF family toxin [Phycisphaerales bacterium]